MRRIRAVLFDMDGVLIDAQDWHYEALNKALSVFGFRIGRFDHLQTFDGMPTKRKLQLLSEQYYLPAQLHGLISELKQKYTQEMTVLNCRPLFVHEYALSKLHRDGYSIAVCSNSIRATIEMMMKRSALTEYVDFIVSNEDVNNEKPDPEMYLKAIGYFGLSPDECLVVEDNPKGILAGKRSGAHVLEVKDVYETNYENIISVINDITRGDMND